MMVYNKYSIIVPSSHNCRVAGKKRITRILNYILYVNHIPHIIVYHHPYTTLMVKIKSAKYDRNKKRQQTHSREETAETHTERAAQIQQTQT